jgi:hypothetical protein
MVKKVFIVVVLESCKGWKGAGLQEVERTPPAMVDARRAGLRHGYDADGL